MYLKSKEHLRNNKHATIPADIVFLKREKPFKDLIKRSNLLTAYASTNNTRLKHNRKTDLKLELKLDKSKTFIRFLSNIWATIKILTT